MAQNFQENVWSQYKFCKAYKQYICIAVLSYAEMSHFVPQLHGITLVQLYNLEKAIVRPSLEYCSQVWHPCLKEDHQLEKLEKVQRRATECLTGLKDCSYSERLAKLKLPSLSYQRH